MTKPAANLSARSASNGATVVRTVTVIMGVVVGLTFLFGFGNVLNLALRLGVPVWVAPLVAPAVDLSILGLLLGTRHLALAGASTDILRPARRLLVFASVVTLALNVADPVVAGEYGKAAFDAVGPLLLIGWAEVGPGFLQAIGECSSSTAKRSAVAEEQAEVPAREHATPSAVGREIDQDEAGPKDGPRSTSPKRSPEKLLELARGEDAAHRAAHQKPISADTLRARLGIGAAQARQLVKAVRSEFQARAEGGQQLTSVLRNTKRVDPLAA
ncbi:hypothetical protein ATK30_4947 [Amycolatopsis echigonensis]|uniref:DUF2637 domain-containing protein n=2 Tax=Pseudonocardiaceae TaxID=2070 RepID=A0A2N3WJN6_9PSEU|nr:MULTISPECIES: hypothetical protein [Pseudonocardiaceae]AEA23564.1 hypothetical protein Psed_1321 [Pseudonocardia dioxanivorans CB1190]PKV94078.1 hypothetical protein ATK30_4947 [Amycolatopsis niigatensis]